MKNKENLLPLPWGIQDFPWCCLWLLCSKTYPYLQAQSHSTETACYLLILLCWSKGVWAFINIVSPFIKSTNNLKILSCFSNHFIYLWKVIYSLAAFNIFNIWESIIDTTIFSALRKCLVVPTLKEATLQMGGPP